MNYTDRYILISPFARVVNKVNWRFGREYQCNNHNPDDLKKILKPGMILLSHKNFSFRQYTKSFYCSELIYWAYFRSITSNGNDNNYYQTITEFLGEKIIMPQHFTESENLWEVVNCC